MNDSSQYMVQVGDYDQNTYIIQDANGVPVQYEGSTIISGDIADGNNMISEPRWIQQNSARGGKIMNNQAFVNGDLVSVNGTGLNLSTRFTPSSIVLNSTSGAQFDQDSLRITSAVTGTGGRGRPRGRKPSRGNFPVVPIDMVRQLGIEQQVILQPTVPVATKNKAIQTNTIRFTKASQCNDIGINEIAINTDSNTKCIHVPVFIPIPVPVYIPVPTFVREKPKVIEAETFLKETIIQDEDSELIVESADLSEENSTKPVVIAPIESQLVEIVAPVVISQDKHVTISNDERAEEHVVTPPRPPTPEQSVEIVTANTETTISEPVVTSVGPIKQKRSFSETETMTPAKHRRQENPVEKKESDSCKLKYSYGINAWRHWSKSIDLLKLSVTDINKYLTEFVQKIRKPTNEAYVPDSIFYLCLGIQLFLLEHKNNINLFVDSRLVGFQNGLNKILATFTPKLDDNHVLVCRIEEDHLWESQQLGSHSPGVLLFTVCYLMTKQLKLKTADEHTLVNLDQLEVNETEITFRSNDDDVKYVLCQPTNTKRCFYTFVSTYIAKCNEIENKQSPTLYLRPLLKTVNNGDLWFEPSVVDLSFLDMMLNRIRIVKEVQERLLSSN